MKSSSLRVLSGVPPPPPGNAPPPPPALPTITNGNTATDYTPPPPPPPPLLQESSISSNQQLPSTDNFQVDMRSALMQSIREGATLKVSTLIYHLLKLHEWIMPVTACRCI